MKKLIRIASAVVAALALALVPAVSAQAVTLTGVIMTDTSQLATQYSTAVSPDRTVQAIFSDTNNSITLVRTADDTQVLVSDPNSDINYPYYGAFSADGTTLYAGNYSDDVVLVIDVGTATVVDTFTAENDENTAMAVSPDGTKLVIADDYSDISVYDLTNNYAELGTASEDDDWAVGVFFHDDSTLYVVHNSGLIAKWDISNPASPTQVGSSYQVSSVSSTYAACATHDQSVLLMTQDTTAYAVDITNGDELGSLDLGPSGAVNLSLCDVTPLGTKAVFTDWSYPSIQAVIGQGHVFVVDVATMKLDATVDTTSNVLQTNGVNIMDTCKVYVDGYIQNIAILELDETECVPALPDTGASQGLIITLAAVGGGLVILGAVAVFLVRRRQQKTEG